MRRSVGLAVTLLLVGCWDGAPDEGESPLSSPEESPSATEGVSTPTEMSQDGTPTPEGQTTSPTAEPSGVEPTPEETFQPTETEGEGSPGAQTPTASATPSAGDNPEPPTPAPGTTPVESLKLMPCTVSVSTFNPAPDASTAVEGMYRYIRGNGIPNHDIGTFPNSGNPHGMEAQNIEYRMPLMPSGVGEARNLGPMGVLLNGVKLDPGANEFWQGDPESGWQYEPMAGGISLGLDCNTAHIQPSGAYHYHALPQGLLDVMGSGVRHYFVGYASDGAPIYARYGYDQADNDASTVRSIISSYRLKSGTRPDGQSGPGGPYDGTFIEDYEYVEGLGDLDACNGRYGETPEHGSVYHYYLTDNYPYIPRCTLYAPDPSFDAPGPPPR